MKTTKVSVLLFLLTISAGIVSGQTKDTDAVKVLNDYVVAVGGEKAVNKIQNLVSNSKLEFVGSDLSLERKIVETSSNQYFIEVNSAQTGKITRTIDGTICREKKGLEVREIAGEEKQSFMNSSAFMRCANWEKTLAEYKYEGLQNEDGKTLQKLGITSIYGAKESWYFDKETHLLFKIEEELELFGEKAIASTFYSDYRKVNGVKLPFKQTIKMPNQTREINFSEMQANQDIDKSIFSLR